MNAVESLAWLDSPSALDATVQRIKDVKSVGLDVGLCVFLLPLGAESCC